MNSIVHCRLCHADAVTTIFVLQNSCPNISFLPTAPQTIDPIDLPVLQCGQCGFVQLDEKYQGNVDYSDYYMAATTISQQLQSCMKVQADLLTSFLNKQDKILEVGCGDGTFLAILKQYPFMLTGLEPSKLFWNVAMTKHDIIYREVLTDSVAGGPFHAIVAREVLEHVADIHDFIRCCAANLYTDGILFLQVPRFETIINYDRAQNFFTDHLNYFKEQDLKLLLSMHGFQVMVCREDMGGEFTVIVAYKHNYHYGMDKLFFNWNRNLDKARKLLSQHNKIVFYGAGGKGLTLLSSLELKPSPRLRLVDDDDMKINRYTPVTNFLVEPSSIIPDYQPDAIIILAEAYTDEIKAKWSDYPDKLMTLWE